MWLFLPWAATCVSKKFGLQVTLLLYLAHRNRSVIMNTIVLALNKKNHSISTKSNGTQTSNDREAASGSLEESQEGPCQMETDVSSCSKGSYAKSHSAETAVSLLGYDYNMYAGVPP